MAAFPSLSGLGGVRRIGKSKTADELPKHRDKRLSELNQGTGRMVDTYIYDYPSLVRENPDPFATVTDKDLKVAVIGAGFAGATAVYELRRAEVKNITVYEGRGKIGGRADSRTFTDQQGRDYTNEMGPMRVPENSKLFWHYFSQIVHRNSSEPGKPIYPILFDPIQKIFPNPGVVATQLVYRGVPYTWKDEPYPQPPDPAPQDVVDWGQLSQDMGAFMDSLTLGGITLGEVADLLQKPTLSAEDEVKINVYWSYFLEKYDYVSFIGALEEYFGDKWGAQEYNMFSTLGLGSGGFGPLFPVCFLEIFRLLLWEYENEYSPSLPMTEIVKRLLGFDEEGNPPDDIQIRYEPVTYVGLKNGDSNTVNVHSIDPTLKSADRLVVDQFDYVIIATTLRSMQIGMNLDAQVAPTRYSGDSAVFAGDANEMLRESLRIPHIMNSSKLFGFLPKKPWEDPQTKDEWPHHKDKDCVEHPIKCVLTDTLARQMYYLDPYPEDDNAGSNVLISYNWGDDSVKIMGILDYQPNQVINPRATPNFNLKGAYETSLETTIPDNPVAKSLEQITIDKQRDDLQSVVWQQEPMILGAFKLDYPNQFYYTSQLVYQYHYANSEKPEQCKRVYIAGNNTSFQGGWIEGAMQSAVNAASAVLKDMSQNGHADAFRMDDLFQPNPFQHVLDTLGERYVFPKKDQK